MFRPFLQPSRCPNPPPELRQEAGCSQGWWRGITRPITLSGQCQESSSREHRKLTRIRLSFPKQMRLHQHYPSQTGLLSRKQTWLFPQGESWNELSRVASFTCFPVRRSKCSWFSLAGMEGREGFRDQVSSQPWTPGNQTPHHLPHLMPKSDRLGESGPVKSILLLSNPI